jgi:hypothetical protein
MLEVRDWPPERKFINYKPLTIQVQVGKRSTVGARGFEPPTSCTPCKRASRTAPRPGRPAHIIARCRYSDNPFFRLPVAG